MAGFDDFLFYFLIFIFSPFFLLTIGILMAWILFIVNLKKKSEKKSKALLTWIGVIVGILIVIAYPLGCCIFSGPVRFM